MQHLFTKRVVRLVFLEGSSLSNPMEVRCRVAPKERGCADIYPAQAVASQSQPWCSIREAVLCSSSAQGKIRGRAILSLHGSKAEPEGLCHHLQAQCCRT